MGPKEISLLYYLFNIAVEILGIMISSSSLGSPDLLPIIRFSLYVCIVVDSIRAVPSLLAMIFALIWGSSRLDKRVKESVVMGIYIFTGAGLVASAGLCVFYELNYRNTDMAATPWLSTYYYLGIAAYALMKSLLFGTAGYYFAEYVKSLPDAREYVPVRSTANPVEMPQRYYRVPVYNPQ